MLALAAPVLLGVTGTAIEIGRLYHAKSVMQAAGDAASLAGARALSLAGHDTAIVSVVTRNSVERFVTANAGDLVVKSTAVISREPIEVRVIVEAGVDLPLGSFLGKPKTQLTTESVTRVLGKPNLCILGLDNTEPSTILLGRTAKVTGNNCSAFSNSTDGAGITSVGGGELTASTICSAGGFSGPLSNFRPRAMSDCPGFNDPLATRSAPPVGPCVHNQKKISGMSITLQPGVYCGGLTIANKSDVTLAPGMYVIKDGPFEVGTGSRLIGNGVGLYFTGTNSMIRFKNDSEIVLRAPVDGPLAGLLVFSDRAQSADTSYVINSENARVLVGTIYIPNGQLVIDSPKAVGDLSEYTALVARQIDFRQGNVVLNTDYGRTNVPVPEGIRAIGQSAALYK